MFKRITGVLFIAFGLAVGLSACGDTNTSGSISMSAPTIVGKDTVTTDASYKPDTGSTLPGQKISFSWRTVGKVSNIITNYPPSEALTDSSGKAISTLIMPSPRTETFTVYVKADTGGLTTGFQSVDIAP